MTMKKTLVVTKSIVKARDPGDEVENEVINSENLNMETELFWRDVPAILKIFDFFSIYI